MRVRALPLLALTATAAAVAVPTPGWAAPSTGTSESYVQAQVVVYVHGSGLDLTVRDFGDRTEVRGSHREYVTNDSSTFYDVGVDTDGDGRTEPAVLPGGLLTTGNGARTVSFALTDVPVRRQHSVFQQRTNGVVTRPASYEQTTEHLSFSGAFAAGGGRGSHDRQHGTFSNSDGTCMTITERTVYAAASLDAFDHHVDVADDAQDASITQGTRGTGPC